MSKTLSKKPASLADQDVVQGASYTDYQHMNLDELSTICQQLLMDENLEVSKVRPFFWKMVETYVDRFQVFPFDAKKALFAYLELHDYPEEQMRDLVRKLEKQYKKQHGESMRSIEQSGLKHSVSGPVLEDEISQLRDTLKYAAIAGERIDGED